MSTRPTPGPNSRAANGYAYADPRARYFVYFLRDVQGEALYVGRSCNVAGRIRAHYSDATHQFDAVKASKALWFVDVRSVDMVGPFLWTEAVAVEREHIERLQPVGNIALTRRAGRRLRSVA